MAPPVSQDQFRLLCPEWSKGAENDGRPANEIAATSAAAAIVPRLDSNLITWSLGSASPTRAQLRGVLKVTAALMAAQKVATARRTSLSTAQELSVIDLLEANGWTKLPSKLIDKRAAVAPKHFMHKTRFATKTRPQEVDIACRLRDTFVLAMECKVTNDETNSVKRINDILKKATAWHEHWGSFVLTAALLDGVVAAKDVRRLEEAESRSGKLGFMTKGLRRGV